MSKGAGSALHRVGSGGCPTLLGFDDFVSILLKGGCMGSSSDFLKRTIDYQYLPIIIIKFIFLEIVIVF